MKKKNTAEKIPAEGSLGLLAQGAAGLRAWRQRREAIGHEKPRHDS